MYIKNINLNKSNKNSLTNSLLLIFFVIASLTFNNISYALPSPMEEIKSTLTQIIKINNELSGDAKSVERKAKLRDLINPRFDFEEMSKRSLGAHWSEVTPEQQKEFVRLFSDLLARTYLNRIESVKEDTVKFDSEDIRSDEGNSDGIQKGIVKTTVVNNNSNFPIHYKLMLSNGSWRVYDVVIENIGLVANYRTEFSSIIRKEKFEGLLQKLQDKQRS